MAIKETSNVRRKTSNELSVVVVVSNIAQTPATQFENHVTNTIGGRRGRGYV